ncbi:MAG: glycosyltransferase family 4 protein [Thermoplasmatota archaeon]
MTVAHVYGAYVASRTEGISANVHGLCQALGRAGAHVRQDCVPTDLDRLNSHATLAASAWRGARCVRQARVDASVSLVHHHVSLLSTALAGRKPLRTPRLRRAAPPVVVQAWNAVFEPGSAAALPLRDRMAHRFANGPEAARLALRGIDDLIVSSRYQLQQLESLRFEGRTHVVPNGVDLEACRPRTSEEAHAARAAFGLTGDPVLLYYGHATPWKGLRVLLAALPEVLREQPRLQVLLSLTGYGRDRHWLEASLRADLPSASARRVTIVGPSDLGRLHAAADLAVLPAPAGVGTACYPNVLLECLAAGVPVVATEVGCVPEVVHDGSTGLLAPPSNAKGLGARISELAADPALRRRLAVQARGAMEARFGWDTIAQRMLGVYRTLGVEAAPRGRPPRPTPSGEARRQEGQAIAVRSGSP